jgi:hypothetical protein
MAKIKTAGLPEAGVLAAMMGLQAAQHQKKLHQIADPTTFSEYMKTRRPSPKYKSPMEAGLEAAQNAFMQSLIAQQAPQK